MSNHFAPRPIVIVGAPRSGTTWLQHVLREQAGMASLPAESEFIWERFTHPALNDWSFEGWNGDGISPTERERVQAEFRRYAMAAPFWQRANPAMRENRRRRWRAALLRPLFHATMRMRDLLLPLPEGLRLVEKSVNSALFLPLVDAVFPDARYVFITRSPRSAIASIRSGWLNPERFESFVPPRPLAMPDCSTRRWKFSMPPGWERYIDRPVAEVAAFQWQALNEHALEFGATHGDRWLQLSLEDLLQGTGAISRLAAFLEIDEEPLTVTMERQGVINAGRPGLARQEDSELERVLAAVSDTARRLGYE